MFDVDDLSALNAYATALLAAARQGTSLPTALVERWEPYHQLLGAATVAGQPLPPIFASIPPGSSGSVVLPATALALTREALFPVEAASATQMRLDWHAASSQLDAAIRQAHATPPALARLGLEPVLGCLHRVGTHVTGTLAAPGLSLARQFALVSALYAASGGDTPAAAFTLVGSDTPGIQRFIGASVSSKGVAKGLRGRSAFLQLISDAVAQRLLDALDLPRANVIYAAGGNLLLLAPPGVEPHLSAVRQALSAALLEWSGGEIDQALAWVTVDARMLGQDIRPGLSALRQALATARRRPYADLLAGDDPALYARLFAPPREADAVERVPVSDYDDLAQDLARPGDLLFLHRQRAPLPPRAAAWQAALHGLSGGWMYDLTQQPRPPAAPADHLVEAINAPERVPDQASSFRWLAVTTPRDPDGSIRELSSIAGQAPAGRIGVLRMDVDNLGTLFGRELEPATLASVATLSAALDTFFAGWLNMLCQEVEASRRLPGRAQPDTKHLLYTIYSGGDDLFVVGAWDLLPPLARTVQRDFAAFCGGNPALHASAGISIEDERFPIYQLAERAADALDRAKLFVHPRGGAKNALSLLEVVVPWPAFAAVDALVQRLTATTAEPSALLGRLRDMAALDQAERQRLGLPPADPLGDGPTVLGRAQWRGLVALQRAIEHDRGADPVLATLLADLTQGLTRGAVTPYLALAARWADYLWRSTTPKEMT